MSEQEDMRAFFVQTIGGYSEDQYCAGWLHGIEDIVRKKGGSWAVLAFLAGGWPRLSDRSTIATEGQTHDEAWLAAMDWEPLTQEEVTEAKRAIGIAILHEQVDEVARREAAGDEGE